MKIKGNSVTLRPITAEDQEKLRTWRNRYYDSFFSGEVITKEQQRIWYDRYQESGGKDTMFIIEGINGEEVGTIALYDVSIPDRTAKIGRVLLLEEHRGHGYAEEAVGLIVNLAFETMRLYKVKVECFLDNIDAIAIYARNKFKTTTRPIILMERINYDYDKSKPMEAISLSEDD